MSATKNRVCKKCGIAKPLKKFHKCKSYTGKIYRIRTCRKCRRARVRELHPFTATYKERKRVQEWKNKYRGTIEGLIYSNLCKWRKRSNRPCDLTFDYLIALWNHQHGKCFYTGAELTAFKAAHGRKQLTATLRLKASPSLDKLDPTKGYTIGNVVWCSHSANSMKGDLTFKEFKEVCSHIASNCPDQPPVIEIVQPTDYKPYNQLQKQG